MPEKQSEDEREGIERHRLELEEKKFAHEQKESVTNTTFRQRELALKERESGWASRFFSPLTTTLLAGVLTLAGSVAATLLQGQQTLELERTKFETTRNLEKEKFSFSKDIESQKQQHELVVKMISVSDTEQAKKNLTFLARSGLISDDLANKITAAITQAVPNIPPSVQSAPSRMSLPTADPNVFMVCDFNSASGRYDICATSSRK